MTKELKKQIVEYYIKYPWLTALHVHIGSQVCSDINFTEAFAHLFCSRSWVGGFPQHSRLYTQVIGDPRRLRHSIANKQ